MNERIRELAEQAIIVVDNHTLIEEEELKKMYIPDCFAEKFAELIVGECARCVEHINMQGGGNLGDVIKNKFGVKE